MSTIIPELPRFRLAALPTPLVRLTRLERQFPGAQIWIKRDDLTGLEFSGNKIRKLEFVLADAQRGGCDTIVTEGTPQSNHCRATAAACARLGMRCVLLLRPGSSGLWQGNHLLDHLFGADLRFYERLKFDEQRNAIVRSVVDELRATGRAPRWTPMGASEALGALSYLAAAEELCAQLAIQGVSECDVVVAVSSGGTHAGLALGEQASTQARLRVFAVPVSDDVAHHRRVVSELCSEAVAALSLPLKFDAARLRFIDGYVGAGYAVPYAAAIDAIRLLAREEAIILDPVYTAKAFCGLLAGLRDGALGRERPVVFIHTGGIFSNFAWPELFP